MPIYTVWTSQSAIRNYQVSGSSPTGRSKQNSEFLKNSEFCFVLFYPIKNMIQHFIADIEN